jgi:hypothetical protein
MENLEYNGNISRALDTIRQKIKFSAEECLGYCEPEHRKPRFNEECSKLADRRKQADYSGCKTHVR